MHRLATYVYVQMKFLSTFHFSQFLCFLDLFLFWSSFAFTFGLLCVCFLCRKRLKIQDALNHPWIKVTTCIKLETYTVESMFIYTYVAFLKWMLLTAIITYTSVEFYLLCWGVQNELTSGLHTNGRKTCCKITNVSLYSNWIVQLKAKFTQK